MRPRFKKKKSFEDKNPEFISEVAGLSRDDLKSRLARLVQGLRDNDAAEKADHELTQKKSEVKEMKAPYTETKKVTREKMNYVSKLIEEKGGA